MAREMADARQQVHGRMDWARLGCAVHLQLDVFHDLLVNVHAMRFSPWLLCKCSLPSPLPVHL